MVRVVSTLEQVHERCGTGNFDACAKFIAFRLEARCSTRGASWSMEASATFRPWITLYNIRKLPHEHEHIADVRESVAGYVTELETLAFPTEGQCQQSVRTLNESFGEKMGEFAIASNSRHHRPTKPLVTGTRRPASAVATSMATSGFTSARVRR